MDFYISNDNVLTLVGLKNSVSGAYLNAATVTVTLMDSEGFEVAGEAWPVTMSYVASSDGNYRATLTKDITGLSNADALVANIEADAGVGLFSSWSVPLTAKTRTS